MRNTHITGIVLLACLLNLTTNAAQRPASPTESRLTEAARKAREAAGKSEGKVYSNDDLVFEGRFTVGGSQQPIQDDTAEEPLQEEVFKPALLSSGAPPIIPVMAVGGGQEWLRVSLNSAGIVTGVESLLEAAVFSDVLRTAVRGWSFIPATLDDEPVESEVLVAAVFRAATVYDLPGLGTPEPHRSRAPPENLPFPTETPPPLHPPRVRDSGVVIVEVEVGVDGAIGTTRVVSSSSGFDTSAVTMARRWRFQTATRLVSCRGFAACQVHRSPGATSRAAHRQSIPQSVCACGVDSPSPPPSARKRLFPSDKRPM